jgi:hypothetical protein
MATESRGSGLRKTLISLIPIVIFVVAWAILRDRSNPELAGTFTYQPPLIPTKISFDLRAGIPIPKVEASGRITTPLGTFELGAGAKLADKKLLRIIVGDKEYVYALEQTEFKIELAEDLDRLCEIRSQGDKGLIIDLCKMSGIDCSCRYYQRLGQWPEPDYLKELRLSLTIIEYNGYPCTFDRYQVCIYAEDGSKWQDRTYFLKNEISIGARQKINADFNLDEALIGLLNANFAESDDSRMRLDKMDIYLIGNTALGPVVKIHVEGGGIRLNRISMTPNYYTPCHTIQQGKNVLKISILSDVCGSG